MNRRDFFTAATATGLCLGASPLAALSEGSSRRHLIELRTYRFTSVAKRDAFDEFLARAAVPALGRAGVGPVGVFRLDEKDNPKQPAPDGFPLYVLLPHQSCDSVAGLTGRLSADPDLVSAGSAVIEAPKSDPAYLRYESSLLLAFDGFPRVRVPTLAATRLLQLRIYESHSTERAIRKIEMFTEGGELEIFDRVGLTPVFFGEALIGSRLPNLTYMLSFEDEVAQKKAWSAFGADPRWKELRADPMYKDTVSNITNLILRPAKSSQI